MIRQEIIWSKPDPTPESVRDRVTRSHETIFLLTKTTDYWFDVEAIKEPAKWGDGSKGTAKPRGSFNTKGTPRRDGEGFRYISDTRRKRSVWEVATSRYRGAHFAMFPPDLIEPCILAGCPPDGTVLDPFGGSGTTAGVAASKGRDSVIIEPTPITSGTSFRIVWSGFWSVPACLPMTVRRSNTTGRFQQPRAT